MIDAASQIRRLFAWDRWANGVLIATLQTVNDPPDETVRIMSHIIGTQGVWLARIRGDESGSVWPSFELQSLRPEFDAVASRWERQLESISDDDLLTSVTYRNTRGDEYTSLVYDIAHHVVIHGAHHRGQVNLRMREAGLTPPWTDYVQAARTGSLPDLE